MVAPLFFAPEIASAQIGSEFLLGGAEGKHAAVVRRMRAGEDIQLTDGKGFRASGRVARIEGSAVAILIEKSLTEQLPLLQLTLVQALAKGDRDELAVQAATELGALNVIPWQATRSVSRWEGVKAEKGRQRWQTIATEAAKQSLRVFEPNVQEVVSTKELVRLIPQYDTVLVLDPTSKLGLSSLKDLKGKIAIVVGPEGGIDDHELEAMENAGAKRVHMGFGILRTSTAGMAAISFLVGGSGLWNTAE
jgi:16S rRNA (uracil1498-N3)-methyltransferase